MDIDFGGGEDIKFSREGRAGFILLNRPSSLNSLNIKMLKALDKALKTWEQDDQVGCVVISGEGRAFCSGADIVAVYNAGKAQKPAYEFFALEYQLNAYLGRFSKPYISFLDGIVMGGGAGVSIHGSHRIATENTIFAMPEASIGFFCDAGASYFLPRMSDNFGLYLGLTGDRIRWGDFLQMGLATHAVAQKDILKFKQALIATGDPRPILEEITLEPDFETSLETRTLIKDAFSVNTLDDCIKNLQLKDKNGNEFAKNTLARLEKMSPTSLRVIFKQLTELKSMGLEDCMRTEYKIAHHMLDNHDLYEGIRAALVDKDLNPQWSPNNLIGVTGEIVSSYFAPIDKGLTL